MDNTLRELPLIQRFLDLIQKNPRFNPKPQKAITDQTSKRTKEMQEIHRSEQEAALLRDLLRHEDNASNDFSRLAQELKAQNPRYLQELNYKLEKCESAEKTNIFRIALINNDLFNFRGIYAKSLSKEFLDLLKDSSCLIRLKNLKNLAVQEHGITQEPNLEEVSNKISFLTEAYDSLYETPEQKTKEARNIITLMNTYAELRNSATISALVLRLINGIENPGTKQELIEAALKQTNKFRSDFIRSLKNQNQQKETLMRLTLDEELGESLRLYALNFLAYNHKETHLDACISLLEQSSEPELLNRAIDAVLDLNNDEGKNFLFNTMLDRYAMDDYALVEEIFRKVSITNNMKAFFALCLRNRDGILELFSKVFDDYKLKSQVIERFIFSVGDQKLSGRNYLLKTLLEEGPKNKTLRENCNDLLSYVHEDERKLSDFLRKIQNTHFGKQLIAMLTGSTND